MTELKTHPNTSNVDAFINSIGDQKKQQDCHQLLKMMNEITGTSPVMWGDSIVGFGSYHYVYESGREGDWFLTGFSPRKQALTIYAMGGFGPDNQLLEKLGKYKKGVGCLYIKKLDDINLSELKILIVESIKTLKKRYAEFN